MHFRPRQQEPAQNGVTIFAGCEVRRLCGLVTVLSFAVCISFSPMTYGAHYVLSNSNQELLGALSERTLSYEDTFAKIARIEGVGFNALQRANPEVDPWLPGEGTSLLVPKMLLIPQVPRQGVVINLSELRLYYFAPDGQQVFVYPIGIGSEGTATPLMQTQIVAKIENPVWFPPASVRARHAAEGKPLARRIEPGPDNPLGRYALQLGRKAYFIHGTNQPIGVGRRVSSGCIRLFEDDIAALTEQVTKGTSVTVIQQPYKVGWHEGQVFLEAHTPIEAGQQTRAYSGFVAAIISATTTQKAAIDWQRALEVARAGSGIPVRISR